MGVIYSPLLLITALIETIEARKIDLNRRLGEEDDNALEEWEEMAQELGFQNGEWEQKVQSSRPNVEVDLAVLEVRQLKEQVNELTTIVKDLKEQLLQQQNGQATSD